MTTAAVGVLGSQHHPDVSLRTGNGAIALRGSAVLLPRAAFCETYIDIANLKRT